MYITLAMFIAFIIFQTLYILVPLFMNEKKTLSNPGKKHSFSVIVPAYNEEKVIGNCIYGFLHLNYEHAELIIVNDGSKDHTLDHLTTLLRLVPVSDRGDQKLKHEYVRRFYQSTKNPNIFVIDKINGGKADALNAGINFSKNEIVITLDADSILEPNSLSEMNQPFQQEHVIACGGNVLISQAFKGSELQSLTPIFSMKAIVRFQFLQYLTAFYLHKRTQATLGAIIVIAGAFGAFRRETLFQINGFRKTIGEDMDITLKLHKWIKENGKQYTIAFVPTAICYTECPSSLKDMFKQRVRWQKAFIDCLIYYRTCYFRKLSKRLSIFFLGDGFLLGTLNAFLIASAPVFLVINKGPSFVIIILASIAGIIFAYQNLTTIIISHLHGVKFSKLDLIRIFLFIPVEIFVFRIINLTFVIYGTISYVFKAQTWDSLERSGSVSWKEVERA